MTRLSESRGFTLMELVVAMALGMIVLLAAFTVIDQAFLANKRVSDREDALQRGRITLELMTRQLRSMTCAGETTPVSVAKDDSVSFYAYLGDPTAGGSQLPDLHTLTYANNAIAESDYTVTSVDTTPPTVSATPYRTRTLITNVQPVDSSTPVFTYYTFDPNAAQGSGAMVPLSTQAGAGVAASDLPQIVKIEVSFLTRPTGLQPSDPLYNRLSTTFQDDAFWRAVDPETPNAQPCAQGVG